MNPDKKYDGVDCIRMMHKLIGMKMMTLDGRDDKRLNSSIRTIQNKTDARTPEDSDRWPHLPLPLGGIPPLNSHLASEVLRTWLF